MKKLNFLDLKTLKFHKPSGLEIDFVTYTDNAITPIEVKATSGRSKSLQTILKDKSQYNVSSCIKLSVNNISKVNNIINLPYYLFFLLN